MKNRIACLLAVSVTTLCGANEVTKWNDTSLTLAVAAGQIGVMATRPAAMVHAAIHDALNSINRRYTPYALERRSSPAASPEAAVATAANAVLLVTVPTQKDAIDQAYRSSLAAIADGQPKNDGIAAGQAAAATILARRSADGSAAAASGYTVSQLPGQWQPTPPAMAPALLPGWGNILPFTLRAPWQFRADPPPDIISEKYAAQVNEVKVTGGENSTLRTGEQSEIARFWYEGSVFGWNRIARQLSDRRGLDLWDSARLFALLNFAVADGYIASFESKYLYNLWRPVSAIREADTDGSADTNSDPAWNSYLATPAFPEWPSAHAVVGAAMAEVLADCFGTDFITFTTTSGVPYPDITRSFVSFSGAAHENAISRVLAGIHYRASVSEGLRMGQRIGDFIFHSYLRPLR